MAAASSARSVASQSLAAFAVLLINITSGMGLGWPSPAWIKLTEPAASDNHTGGPGFILDVDEASWVVALYDTGIPLGSVLAGLLLSSAGRRRTLMLAPLLVMSSCALAATASSSTPLKVARVLHGMSFGMEMSLSSLYIGEMTSSDMRGKLCTFTSSLVFVGVLIEYIIGPYVSYLAQALLPVPFALLSLVLCLVWVPESPYFLAARGRHEEMHRALARLRGLRAGDRHPDVDGEAEEILRFTEQDRRRKRIQWRHLLSSAGSRRGCLIVLFLCGTAPLTGTGCLLAYAEYMFRTTGSALPSEIAAIIMSSVQVAAGVASSQVIDRAGRRPLLLVSSLCNAGAMVVAGIFFFLRDALGNNEAASHITWLPLAALMVFMVSNNLGTTTVPWVMIGELLPLQVKAFIPSLSVLGFSIVAFSANKLLPVLVERVGLFLPFWTFGAWSIVIFVFTFFMVPETRGKTLLEVQALLEGDKAKLRHQEATALDPEDNQERC
ncbi:facilitated trehalose transporter Tret1-like [Frankliniella occidentalis]|uniref:Facilitated trehalose transporter Tret1-like n=1 Tax=Frankliniella occidentalis TaxID=133901 RepID=A0A9C6WZV0_FRAOC|nr:facilitated trehalose transporter Tret1-like [Frankliniella occidentalis]